MMRLRLALPCLALLLLSACSTSRPVDVAPDAPRTVSAPAPGPMAGMRLPGDYQYPAHDSIRVATWNVEHLVDAYDDPYVNNRREDAAEPLTDEQAAQFAAVLRALDADVVVLQEIESAAFAQALADSLVPDLGYRFAAGAESPTWYQNVAVLSRLPLGVLRSFTNVWTPVPGQTDDEGRPAAQSLVNNRIWMVDVLGRPDYAFTLIGAHLKAGRGARNEAWRTGQVQFIHTELARQHALDPDANVLVAGDLNALPGSPEFVLLLNADQASGPVAFADPLADVDAWTHPADDPQRQLDHLLPSLTMLPELVPGSMEVATPLTLEAMRNVSDHLPVVATFLARD